MIRAQNYIRHCRVMGSRLHSRVRRRGTGTFMYELWERGIQSISLRAPQLTTFNRTFLPMGSGSPFARSGTGVAFTLCVRKESQCGVYRMRDSTLRGLPTARRSYAQTKAFSVLRTATPRRAAF